MSSPVFGKYEIIRRLAVGGMGEIFLARQSGVAGFDRLVILKSLLPDLAEDPRFVEQFLDEARVAATLNHPNIVAIYEVGLWEGTYFIAMEYIHGIALSSLLRETARAKRLVPPGVAARLIHDAALALDHAHRASSAEGKPLEIVHRDVSPQNIMVRDDGNAKVVDFGIARAADRSTRTATGVLKGKLRYMPPEQLAGLELDRRSDQFALGVVFWELCARRRLFKEDNQLKIMQTIENDGIQAPSVFLEAFPGKLDEVILRMLRKLPEDRYPSCREVAEDLVASGLMAEASGVAAFVQEVGGHKIDAVTSDLTPSQDNFVISFTPTGPTATTPMRAGSRVTTPSSSARARRRGWTKIGAAFAVLGLVAGLALLVLGGDAGEGDAGEGGGERRVEASSLVEARPDAGAALDAAVATSVLSLRSTPPGALVRIGDQVLGTTPVAISTLAPRVQHTLSLSKRGWEPGEVTVQLAPGEARVHEVSLSRRRAPAARATGADEQPAARRRGGKGTLSINTKPWTQVSIDGKPRGTTPLIKLELSSGAHKVRLVNPQAGIDQRRSVRVESQQHQKLNLDLR